ncbi:hypothetical protein K4K49_000129 [Colletotrichum sp. SAR 10_70]|nr:hypothetical protein K4K50_009519 [Colletotrichum sp. SAR 10_71]KAI8191833.1 hypothetical protein K4K51_010000 [Colletotrichum sp. SAR 10_75]KAI8204891.1 hypothetical protein K4K49_000129 [Colletotrichum sp. SAR 10_70]KAI8205072.1 hypothetical protein KHU50_002209 [Colletotrichum sp. SAR 10_65]KAI8234871.1 hypothetical protein K4K54_007391 [Colletotrichum sp. SAR 10_86]KAI8264301.1 hypothetical protein K4K53_003590 [Colletotrichum sp. SAR 10_77]
MSNIPTSSEDRFMIAAKENDEIIKDSQEQIEILRAAIENAHKMIKEHLEKMKEAASAANENRKLDIIEQTRLQDELADKQWEATKAMATGSLALYNQNKNSSDAFEKARRLGPKIRRSGAQGKVKTCIYCYQRFTANDECRRHLKLQHYAEMWPDWTAAEAQTAAERDAP